MGGVLAHDAQHLMKRLCDQIAMKWEKSHSEVMGWSRARIASSPGRQFKFIATMIVRMRWPLREKLRNRILSL